MESLPSMIHGTQMYSTYESRLVHGVNEAKLPYDNFYSIFEQRGKQSFMR